MKRAPYLGGPKPSLCETLPSTTQGRAVIAVVVVVLLALILGNNSLGLGREVGCAGLGYGSGVYGSVVVCVYRNNLNSNLITLLCLVLGRFGERRGRSTKRHRQRHNGRHDQHSDAPAHQGSSLLSSSTQVPQRVRVRQTLAGWRSS